MCRAFAFRRASRGGYMPIPAISNPFRRDILRSKYRGEGTPQIMPAILDRIHASTEPSSGVILSEAARAAESKDPDALRIATIPRAVLPQINSSAQPAPRIPLEPRTTNLKPRATTITPALIRPLFPFTPLANIAANLPHVLAALAAANLTDTPMLLAALATIRAEAEPFLPLTE